MGGSPIGIHQIIHQVSNLRIDELLRFLAQKKSEGERFIIIEPSIDAIKYVTVELALNYGSAQFKGDIP
jgi:hypothetical protein